MKKISLIILVFSIILASCKKNDSDNETTNAKSISGIVQKGPFINGSSITVYDLQSNLSPTGKTFNTQITDNKGSFQLSNISLSSNYVSLRADGFYFNEISGQQSNSQITLYAISDISGNSDINVNILTHLEKARVEYLINNGNTFSAAKIQAQKEILAIFNIVKNNVSSSENLNISQSGDDNGILLAISSIIQGFRSESEMSELLSNISNDIKIDGTLDNDTLGSALINHAILLDTNAIKSNLVNRYNNIGVAATIPVFGKYIANFISNTSFVITQSPITYPASGLYGSNILFLTDTLFSSGSNNTYSLAAQLTQGMSLKIKITSLSNCDTSNLIMAGWFYVGSTNHNWSISNFDNTTHSQIFTAINSGESCDLRMYFQKGRFLIEYYEMNSNNPTRYKTITVN